MLRLSRFIQSAVRQLLRGLCIARHTMSAGNLPVHHPCNVPGKICFSVWRTLFEVRQSRQLPLNGLVTQPPISA